MSGYDNDSKLLHDTGLCNDEGHAVSQGEDGWDYYYCGLKRDHITIPGTDGRCGPTNGNNCPSCKRFTRGRLIDCSDHEEFEGSDDSDDYDEPQISWTEGPNPSVSITHHGHPVEYEAHFAHNTHTDVIDSKRKYPHLFEDARRFDKFREFWHIKGGTFMIKSVYTKELHDVDVDVFSNACNIMAQDTRGVAADRCLGEFKNMVRHYFKSRHGDDELRGLIPAQITNSGYPDCVKFMTHDWKQRDCMHLGFRVNDVVILVTIEFDSVVTEDANMCTCTEMNKLFELLQKCGALPHRIGAYKAIASNEAVR
jgi:hypothetical protein